MRKRKTFKVVDGNALTVEQAPDYVAKLKTNNRLDKTNTLMMLNKESGYSLALKMKEELENQNIDVLLEEVRVIEEKKGYRRLEKTTLKELELARQARVTQPVQLSEEVMEELNKIEALHGTGSIDNTIAELIDFYHLNYFQMLIVKIRHLYENGIDPIRLAELSVLYTLLQRIDDQIGGLSR